ncbi:MAG: peptidoglycan bridge formation glycyltransferase FemA/FemB family protein [Patescibacteria group bacterium]
MDTRIIRSDERAAWDKMVAAHPHGGVEQSFEWGELQTRIPGRPAFYALGIFEGTILVGGMLVIRQEMGGGKSWLWCPRGPLLAEGRGWNELLAAVTVLAKKSGDVFLRIEPGVPVEEAFVVEGKATENRYFPEHTLVLDLTLSEEDLLAQMTQKGRYNIKQAEKQGVTVSEVGAEGAEDFYKLLADTAERDAFSVHKAHFYEDFLESLAGKLYLAQQDGEVVAGMLVTNFGETATYYFGASSSAHRDSKAPYLLQWTAIRDARRAGLKMYDFLGVAPEGDERHAWSGVTQFKTRFGGKRVSYHSSQVFVFRPFWWTLYRLAKLFRL